jgi:aspartyl-tRNA(Asn)/glutamyl-tRNA(Gln) amidotransferase subunit B
MELGGLFKNEEWSDSRVLSYELAAIIEHVLRRQITGRAGKLLLSMKFQGDNRAVERIIADENMLLLPLSHEEYVALAEKLLEEKEDMVQDIVEKGQHQKVKWFVGQMMARSAEGTVEPGPAEGVLRELLKLPPMEQQN